MSEPNESHPGAPERDLSDDPQESMPGWVKGFVIAGIVIAALVILTMVFRGGDHGPARHLPSGAESAVEGNAEGTPQTAHQ